jgi:hypothetical protein
VQVPEVLDIDDDEEDDDTLEVEPSICMRSSARATGKDKGSMRDPINDELLAMEAKFTTVGLGLLEDAERLRKLRKSLSQLHLHLECCSLSCNECMCLRLVRSRFESESKF